MTDPYSHHTTEITKIIQRLLSLKTRLKAVLPEDLANLKAHLSESHYGSKGSTASYDLLYHIGVILSLQQKPITMGELSRALDVPLSTATRIVDWLEANNYAKRLADPEDRRIVLVTLTDAGQGICRTITDLIQKRVDRLLFHLTSQERQSLIGLMQKLLMVMEEDTGRLENKE